MFIDFLLSPEGQKIFEEKFRFATSTKNYGFKRWYPEKGMTVEQYEKGRGSLEKTVARSGAAVNGSRVWKPEGRSQKSEARTSRVASAEIFRSTLQSDILTSDFRFAGD